MSTSKPNVIKRFLPILIFVMLGIAVLIMVNASRQAGTNDTRSHASRSTFLTPSDDPLSLQQDLNALGNDPTMQDDKSLDAVQ